MFYPTALVGSALALALSCSAGKTARCGAHQKLIDGQCDDRCKPGEVLLGTSCVETCGAREIRVGGTCLPACKRDEERDTLHKDQCLPRCAEGKERFDGDCVDICGEGEQRVERKCVGPAKVKVNTVGYLPDSQKIAVISERSSDFVVIDTQTEKVAFEGSARGPSLNSDTGEELWTADFTKLSAEGTYLVEVDGVGVSPTIRIAENVYSKALEAVTLGFYGLRCGAEVSQKYRGDVFHHGECHLEDALVSFGGQQRLESVGGWHDAGDYGKYVPNGAFSVGMLLMAWEHYRAALAQLDLSELPENGGKLPDFLDEVKWEISWLLTMQRPDGAVFHKLSAANFSGFVLPSADTSPRAVSPVSAEATASFVGALAMAARVYESLDEAFAARCLAAAELSFQFLEKNPDLPDVDLSAFQTGQYKSDDADDRLWAAAELWNTTGNEEALKLFEERALGFGVRANWDWADLANLGVFSYLLSSRTGRDPDLLEELRQSALASADQLVQTAAGHGYGRALGSDYNWGGNGSVARSVINLQVAFQIEPDSKYREAALQQVHHLLGVNFFSRSQVTGVGALPPLAPHHRPSGADAVDAPWPGLLVGGPNPFSGAEPLGFDVSVPAAAWDDVQESYWANEIAINWNAALVYALAGFVPQEP